MDKKKKIYKVIYIILITLIIVSIIYIVYLIMLKKEAKEESELLNTIEVEKENETLIGISNNTEINIKENKEEKTERMLQVQKLKEENSDIVGWLEIEGTSINYPVLQGTDNEFYMTHNYKKEKSKNGSIFLNKDYDWNIESNNLLIYGHNINNGTMFQELLKYENESFYKEHPKIRFTTENEDSIYDIISAFKSKVYYKSEKNVFRYYYFINPKSEEEYMEYIEKAKKASLYNIEETATYGDRLITLSTCSYYTQDGRFAVVARKEK